MLRALRNFVKRQDPVLVVLLVSLAVIGAFAGARALADRLWFREGLGEDGNKRGGDNKRGDSKGKGKYKQEVVERCRRRGYTYERLVQEKPYLITQLGEDLVRHMCAKGRNNAMVDMRNDGDNEGRNFKGQCPNELCKDRVLRALRPCANKDGSRCCRVTKEGKVTDCVDRGKGDTVEESGFKPELIGGGLNQKCKQLGLDLCPDRNHRAHFPCLENDGTRCLRP